MAIELPNHIPTAHDGWLDTKIEFLVQKGSLAPWSTVVETKVQSRSRKCLPLGVEPNNLRVIWDARFLNCMCEHFSFQMDGLGKVAQCSWKGAQQAILYHKSDFHNVPLPPRFLECLGLYCRGVCNVWTVLYFGWCAYPYIYHNLSDAVSSTCDPKTYPPRCGLMTFGCQTSGPRATSARPANRKQPAWRRPFNSRSSTSAGT